MPGARLTLTLLVAGLAAWASGASAGFQSTPKTIENLESSIALVGKGSATEPGGFTRLCRRQPELCWPRSARSGLSVTPTGAVLLTPELTSLVVEVNRLTNQAIRPLAEPRGSVDYWKVGGATGDCEDYALAKRQRLLKAGLPTSALAMATAYLPNGEYHAVLLVRTDRGDYVLDNLVDPVVTIAESRLRFQLIQSAEDPRRWLTI